MANSSIVDFLNSKGQASDYNTRAKLAQQNGITNYTGTAAQNTQMLNTLQNQSAPTPVSTSTSNYSAPAYSTPVSTTNTSSSNSTPITDPVMQQFVGQMAASPAMDSNQFAQYTATANANKAQVDSGAVPSVSINVAPADEAAYLNAGFTINNGMATYSGSNSNTQTPTTPTYPTTGSPNLDALQAAYASWISGSLASGYTINPGLSINNDTVGQFITETANQLAPQFQQQLTNEITGVNAALGNAVTQYLATQGQTIQDFQSGLGSQRNYAGANGMYLGGGENAIEQGLLNSAQRSLDTSASSTALGIGNTLRDEAGKVGQGFSGATAFGTTVPGVTGSLNDFNIPSLYGQSLSLQGGNSTYSGTANQGNALDYNYNPSTYQYGSIPGQYSTDFFNLLNTTGQNYLKGQAATGNYNVTSSYGQQLGVTP